MTEPDAALYPSDVEAGAQAQILAHLRPLPELARCADALMQVEIESISEHPTGGPTAKVGTILLSRLANDLRVCSITASVGYGLQALGLAASLLEILGALAYVGVDDSRAEAWARHADRRSTYPRTVGMGIDAVLAGLGIPEEGEEWRRAYEFACMAKHTNPILSIHQGMHDLPHGIAFVVGPDTTPLGVFLSAEAMYRAVLYGAAAVYFGASHCADNSQRARLYREAGDLRRELTRLEPLFAGLSQAAFGKGHAPGAAHPAASPGSNRGERSRSDAAPRGRRMAASPASSPANGGGQEPGK